MRLNRYLNEKNIITQTMENIKNLSSNKAKRMMKSSWDEFVRRTKDYPELQEKILKLINAQFKTNFRSLEEIGRMRVQEGLDEDFKHYWNWFKDQTWPAISIFPSLSIWFEVDKLLDGAGITDLDFKRIVVYGIMWVLFVTGKHITQWKKWKKENPEQWEKEGKPGPFSRK